MRRLTMLSIATLSGAVAFSQSPLDCIDPDVLRALLVDAPGYQTLNVSTAAAPELAAFKVPRQLTLVGTAERGRGAGTQGTSNMPSSVAAVYRTGIAPDAARTAAREALTAGGWKLHSDERMYDTNVFTSGSSPTSGETYCREGKPAGLNASALDGVTYVVLTVTRNADAAGYNTCNQPPRPMRAVAGLDQYMPKLELPPDPATRQPVSLRSGGGGSSSETSRRASAGFTLKDSVANVARHFAKQMAGQGWREEASWSGLGTAGSTWTRQADAGSTLQGSVVVTAFDGDRFTVLFHAARTK